VTNKAIFFVADAPAKKKTIFRSSLIFASRADMRVGSYFGQKIVFVLGKSFDPKSIICMQDHEPSIRVESVPLD
jgi:hypothetical protein